MSSSFRISRRPISFFIVAGAFVIAGAGAVAAAHPTAAASALATIAANITCSTGGTTACQTVTNTSSGIGFNGVSNTGLGLRGTSTGGIGVKGTTVSPSSFGVYGEAYPPSSSSTTSGIGVGGSSEYGTAVSAHSEYGVGMRVSSDAGYGLIVAGFAPGHASAQIAAQSNDALDINMGYQSTGTAIRVFTNSEPSAGYSETQAANVLIGTTTVGSPSNIHSQDVVSIDGSGNEILAGTLTQSGNPLIRTSTASGEKLATFGNRSASPTLEDNGEATLVNGQAYVRLNPTFASAIDASTKYLAFVTPQGESKGLYVTAISSHGFAVRENASGRSCLTFDYRVVAKPYDMRPMYLPAMSQMHELRQDVAPPKKSQHS